MLALSPLVFIFAFLVFVSCSNQIEYLKDKKLIKDNGITYSSIISTMARIDQPNISKPSSLKEVTLDNEIKSRIEQLKIILKNYWTIFQ